MRPSGGAPDPRRRPPSGRDPSPAVTRYVTCGRHLIAARPSSRSPPVTGRTHQIRVHAANAGAALLGDRAPTAVPRASPWPEAASSSRQRRIALRHAARVTVPDSSGAARTASAPVPGTTCARLWTDIGGAPGDWQEALTCAV